MGISKILNWNKNLISSGVIQCIIYLAASFLLKESVSSPEMEKVSRYTDFNGVWIYAGIALIFLISIFYVWMVQEEWKFGVIIMVVMVLVNFVAVGLTLQILLKKIQGKT